MTEPTTSPDEDWAAVGREIKRQTAMRGVSQKELAGRSGISTATVRAITNEGRHAYGRTLAALSEALGLPSDHLDKVLVGEVGETPMPTDVMLTQLHELRQRLLEVQTRVDALEKWKAGLGA